MSGAASRNRGKTTEQMVARWLRENGDPDARRVLSGDGAQHSDVEWHPLVSLEVKGGKVTRWPEWCRQAVSQAKPGTIAAVVWRTLGNPDVARWLVRVQLDDAIGFGLGCGFVFADEVDGETWLVTSFADFVAAVGALDG